MYLLATLQNKYTLCMTNINILESSIFINGIQKSLKWNWQMASYIKYSN